MDGRGSLSAVNEAAGGTGERERERERESVCARARACVCVCPLYLQNHSSAQAPRIQPQQPPGYNLWVVTRHRMCCKTQGLGPPGLTLQERPDEMVCSGWVTPHRPSVASTTHTKLAPTCLPGMEQWPSRTLSQAPGGLPGNQSFGFPGRSGLPRGKTSFQNKWKLLLWAEPLAWLEVEEVEACRVDRHGSAAASAEESPQTEPSNTNQEAVWSSLETAGVTGRLRGPGCRRLWCRRGLGGGPAWGPLQALLRAVSDQIISSTFKVTVGLSWTGTWAISQVVWKDPNVLKKDLGLRPGDTAAQGTLRTSCVFPSPHPYLQAMGPTREGLVISDPPEARCQAPLFLCTVTPHQQMDNKFLKWGTP